MNEHYLISLTSILVLGVAAQWMAWRLRLPSILLLLLTGILAGPVTGWLHPDQLLGGLLVPVVSISVAVILFEGGLTLKIRELQGYGSAVRNLVTIGAIATWGLTIAAAYYLLRLGLSLAVLFGAILVVTGPTVVGPLLRHVRPLARVGSILRWEGIVIDPIGAMLAVLVFEAILAREPEAATTAVVLGLLKVLLAGSGAGLLGAAAIALMLRYHWAPDFLQSPVTLMIVVCVFASSNLLQSESGLLAVTLMGIVLANQRLVSVTHILEFKENLRVLLLAGLFILLSARLDRASLTELSLTNLQFLAMLMFVVRPASVFLSTIRSGLSWRERLLLSWVAPRGIVAAAVSSIFALRLVETGHPEAGRLVPLTFLVIIGTVIVYGLTAAPVARWLRVAQPRPQGLLIVGAHDWAQALAGLLKAEGFQVLLVDTNPRNVAAARLAGLAAHQANVLSEEVLDEMELAGLGKLLALTSNDEVNALAALHLAPAFGRKEVYQLGPQAQTQIQKGSVPRHLRGRLLFESHVDYLYLAGRFASGAHFKTTALTREFTFADFRSLYGTSAVPLFLISEAGELKVFTRNLPPVPRPGDKLISLVDPIGSSLEPAAKQQSRV